MANLLAKLKELFAKILTFIKTLFDKVEKPGNEIVDYYGCPNSNKAKKLQLESKLWE